MSQKDEKKKYYNFAIHFESETDKDDFLNYMYCRKEAGTPIYKTALEMLELHKEKFKR